MDGPQVNWNVLKLLDGKLVSENLSKTVNIGSCAQHVVHGALKIGTKSSEFDTDKMVVRKFGCSARCLLEERHFRKVSSLVIIALILANLAIIIFSNLAGVKRERNFVLAFACRVHNYTIISCMLYLYCHLAPRTGTKKEQVNILQWRSISFLNSLFLYMRSK